jgi:hypothetical protein
MHKSWSCTKSSTSRSGGKQGIVKSVRGTLQEIKTKNDRRATTARSTIVKEKNTMSVNTTTNHRIERESINERERAFMREKEHNTRQSTIESLWTRSRQQSVHKLTRQSKSSHSSANPNAKATRHLASQKTYLQNCGGDKGRERSREKEDGWPSSSPYSLFIVSKIKT